MATERNFKVVSEKYDVIGICTTKTYMSNCICERKQASSQNFLDITKQEGNQNK
jgi:hypothetical protein